MPPAPASGLTTKTFAFGARTVSICGVLRWTAAIVIRPSRLARNGVRNMPALPPSIGLSCSVCSWIFLPWRKKRTTTVWPATYGRMIPRTRHESRVRAMLRPLSRCVFCTFSLSLPATGTGTGVGVGVGMGGVGVGVGTGGVCASAPAGASSAAATTAIRPARALETRCGGRSASPAGRWRASSATLPARTSRYPHQGSSFVAPNAKELKLACMMMHGTKDAV